MKRILYIVPHRFDRSPGQRFRCEQYMPFLEKNGYKITYSPIISKWDDKYFYKSGFYLHKFFIVLKSLLIRLYDVLRANKYDVIFIYREAFMLGNTFFERQLSKKKAKLIFDFDDAIWLNDTSDGNAKLQWLKRPEKTAKIIALCDVVFAGNNYLAQYAKKYNKNTVIMPTTIDTMYHKPTNSPKINIKKVCIGWTGTNTTLKHFEIILPVLIKLKQQYKDKICFKVIVDKTYTVPELDLTATAWQRQTEIQDLQEIDIGIMPLPDDKWAKGKCGFKGLQYMSIGISPVMSPVGVNTEIITHGENGFLAETDEQWHNALSKLIDNESFRKGVGMAAKKTIEEKYSLKVWQNKYISYF